MANTEYITDPGLYIIVATAKMKCGDYEGALMDLGSALRLSEKNPNIHLLKGICYKNLNMWSLASVSFSKSILYGPKFAKVSV